MPYNGKRCVVPNCENKYGKTGISFHEIPADESIRKQWLKNISRGKDDNPSLPWVPEDDRAVVCSAHFEVSDFRTNTTRRLLEKNAVPTIFDYPSYKRIKPSFKRPPPKERLIPDNAKSKIPKIEDPILSADEEEQETLYLNTFEIRESPGFNTATNGELLINIKNELDPLFTSIESPTVNQNETVLVNSRHKAVQVNSLSAEEWEERRNEWRRKQSFYCNKISRLTGKVDQLESDLESEKKNCSSEYANHIKRIVEASKEEDTEALMLLEQIKTFGKSAPRWSEFYLRKCAEWYVRSPSGYKLARSVQLFSLPSHSTIRKFLEPEKITTPPIASE